MKEMSENMKKISKILGAAAIVLLFLVSAVASTSLAATEAPQFETSEEETQFETSDPADPDDGEPLGIIPADLSFVKPNHITKMPVSGGYKLLVTVENSGFGCIWMPWKMHITVSGVGLNKIWCWGPVFHGRAKTFTSTIVFPNSTLPRLTQVQLDVTDLVNEGIFGELNNYCYSYI
jgi:hypothetical protein